ncbi:hypothetical protein Gotur_015054 [Gossypium turneri]
MTSFFFGNRGNPDTKSIVCNDLFLVKSG